MTQYLPSKIGRIKVRDIYLPDDFSRCKECGYSHKYQSELADNFHAGYGNVEEEEDMSDCGG